MEFSNNTLKREEQIEKILEDTEEIIKNFKEAAKIIIEKIVDSEAFAMTI